MQQPKKYFNRLNRLIENILTDNFANTSFKFDGKPNQIKL